MEKKQKKSLIKAFLPYFKPYTGILVFDLFCAALSTVCELVFPMLIRHITGNVDTLVLGTVLRIGLLYLFLRMVDTAANYYMASVGHIMGARIETDMRRDLFAHLQKLQFSYYDETKVGQIMSRITNDLFDITEFAHHCPEEFFISGIKIIGAFIILGSINLWLTLIMFAALPLMGLFAWVYNRKMRAAFKKSREKVGELNASVEDSLLGIRVVKSFANEDMENEKFRKGNQSFFDVKKLAYHYMAIFQAGTRSFDGIMYVLIMVFGAIFMLNGAIDPADFIAYLLYISTLIASVRRIVEFTEQFQRGMTGIERFCEIVDTPVEIFNREDATELGEVSGDIVFDNVSFRYSDNKGDVLSHISLHVHAGDNVALVGPSGGGKTTLCSLIPRFYDVTDGKILLDGTDIRDVTLESLRSNIGVVQQDVYLFSGTVFENIAYGKPGATEEEVEQAARRAGAHEFIMQLKDGYHTYVGERGLKLSGGQKQRISIARVFLKNPPVLILDEATSALDNESELLVQQSLEELAKGRTTFTIAHRLTTIRNASTILVLTENGIEEQGDHKTLLEKNGLYSKLYSMYTRN